MADYASGLPVRTEADGTDERLHVKVVDGTTPAQRMIVDTDGNAHVEMHGNDPAGTDRAVRTSEAGALTPDGVYDVSTNTKPGNSGLIASARNATPSDATQTQRITSVTNSTKRLLDVAIHDENGDVFSAANPMPVTISESEGVEINAYNTAAAVAAAATSNHDYTVTAAKTLTLTQISAAASGKCKITVSVETAVASGIFTTLFVMFNSTANPNIEKVLREPVAVAAGVRVRIIRANLDNQAQDLYSTISGHEV